MADEKIGTKTVYIILCVETQEREIRQQKRVSGRGSCHRAARMKR